jgi:hypothetical protein
VSAAAIEAARRMKRGEGLGLGMCPQAVILGLLEEIDASGIRIPEDSARRILDKLRAAAECDPRLVATLVSEAKAAMADAWPELNAAVEAIAARARASYEATVDSHG